MDKNRKKNKQNWDEKFFLKYIPYRVLKWWRHKNKISEIIAFVRIFWKNNAQEAYLPKMSISGQIVSEIVAQLCLENSIQTLLNFFSKHNWATISGKICPEMLIFGK